MSSGNSKQIIIQSLLSKLAQLLSDIALTLSTLIKVSRLPLNLLFLILVIQLPAQHKIRKGALGVTISVSQRGVQLPIDSLCDGFDKETNNPINLLIPETGTIVLGMDPSMNILSYQVNSQSPSYINEPAKGAGFSSNAAPGSTNRYTFIDESTADTLQVSWRVEYAKIELIDLYPANQFTNYVSFQFRNLFENYPNRSQYNWLKENYITEVDERGVPVNPEFPYHQNDLFFVAKHVTENAVIQLKGYHDTPQVFDENSPFQLFMYEDLPDGNYEYVIRPYAGAPDAKSLIYSFTVLKPWWFQEWALAGFTVFMTGLVMVVSFLTYRSRQRKREQVLLWKQQLSEAELKAIRAQLNPHFLFNALGSIQNLVTEQKNEAANAYLTKLSRLLRNVLSASENTFHELGSELGLVELYLELEQLRFPFEFEIKVGAEVRMDLLTPVMLLQPFVENAVKHGVGGRKEGEVTLQVNVQDQKLVMKVLDNGAGLTEPGENSSGLQLSKDRIRPLNDFYGDEATITVGNRSDTHGVLVHITLPIE